MPRAVTLVVICCMPAVAEPLARLGLQPSLSRMMERSAQARPSDGGSYAIVAALDAQAEALFDQVFGACFVATAATADNGAAESAKVPLLRADLCTLARGAPALLLLAGQRGPEPPVAALAVADVWVCALSDEETAVDDALERAIAAWARLPAPGISSAHTPQRTLLILVPASRAGLSEHALGQRLKDVCARRGMAVPASEHLRLAVAPAPASDGSGGSELLSRFARPSDANFLLNGARRVPAAVSLRRVPQLVDELLGVLDVTSGLDQAVAADGTHADPDDIPTAVGVAAAAERARSGRGASAHPHDAAQALLADPAEWAALVGCEEARARAREPTLAECAALRDAIEDAALNPLSDVGGRGGQLVDLGVAAYDAAAAAWEGCAARAIKRDELQRELLIEVAKIASLQLTLLQEDSMATFRSELIVLMATSASYNRAAARLTRRALRRYERAARDAIPPQLAARGAGRLTGRARTELRGQMLAEIESHEAEAAELPPREQDVGPPPWWKQLAAQVISIVLTSPRATCCSTYPRGARISLTSGPCRVDHSSERDSDVLSALTAFQGTCKLDKSR